jgi:hypothetical protein
MLRKLSTDDLIEILARHELWLESDGDEGVQANLLDVDFSSLDLKNVNLAYAKLSCANLRGADLRWANLSYADLRDTKLDVGIVGVMSILHTQFSLDALPWLMLRPNWAGERALVHIYDV